MLLFVVRKGFKLFEFVVMIGVRMPAEAAGIGVVDARERSVMLSDEDWLKFRRSTILCILLMAKL